jgi:hypothetical protein
MVSYQQMAQQDARWLFGGLVYICAAILLGGTACVVIPTTSPSPIITHTATATAIATAPTVSAPTTVPAALPAATHPPTPTPRAATALLHVHWPKTRISILPPQPIEIELIAPSDIEVKANVLSSVLDPTGERYGLFVLRPSDDAAPNGVNPRRYISERPLQLPLQPLDGEWHLVVAVQSNVRVTGDQVHRFEPAPLSFCILTDTLHAGVNLKVPRIFEVVFAQGTPWAGGRVWRYQGGEVALWWAPGPLEPLLPSNALVMLETTYKLDTPPKILKAEEAQWPGANPDSVPAVFLFHEMWPGPGGGPAEAYVLQGSDHWLYVLRMRAVGQDTIPSLIRQVGHTLTFSD